jgi:hypothetical protein
VSNDIFRIVVFGWDYGRNVPDSLTVATAPLPCGRKRLGVSAGYTFTAHRLFGPR